MALELNTCGVNGDILEAELVPTSCCVLHWCESLSEVLRNMGFEGRIFLEEGEWLTGVTAVPHAIWGRCN